MGLSKLGEYIEQIDYRNTDNKYNADVVMGISTQKELIDTKANLNGVSLTSYKLLKPNTFVYVPDTSRRGDKVSLAYNTSADTYIISSIYITFRVIDESKILPYYLFMFFNRPEFDRYARFNSWGSARETFSWEDMCDIDIELPPIDIQRKYVNIYNSLLANQKCYERGLEDLKLVCDGYIDRLKGKCKSERIGKYIFESNQRNICGISSDKVMGLSTNKEMIPTKANMDGVNVENYKVFSPMQIAYVPDTSRRGDKISLAFNDGEEDYLLSSISTVFNVDLDYLLPEYLMLFLTRAEFDRYARFNSWGSARETFSWDDMCDVKIPIPNISAQRAIANIYKVYIQRQRIAERLKEQIKNICPVLIRGSLMHAED